MYMYIVYILGIRHYTKDAQWLSRSIKYNATISKTQLDSA